jgi:hypothetical protein|uniref:Uncharacterized protein n=1 Tax=Leptospirillum ferriphilum TaxID=178606 RepID=A0A7C3R2E4_9BACT
MSSQTESTYDRIELFQDLPHELKDAGLGAIAIQAVARVLVGDSAESVNEKEGKPLSDYSREGLLFAVELLAEKITEDLDRYVLGKRGV